MATRYTDLPAAGALGGTEVIAVVQAGDSVQTTAQAIANLASAGAGTTAHVTKNANFIVSTADTKKLYVIDSASAVSAQLPDLSAEVVDYEWALIVINTGGGSVDINGQPAESSNGVDFDFADQNVIMYLYYDSEAGTYYFQNGTAGGATPGIDDVLAEAQALTDDRTIDVSTHTLIETATGPTDYSQRVLDNGSAAMTHSTNDNTQQCIVSVEDGILITDTRTNRGLQGQANYSANLQDNDFVQKNYVVGVQDLFISASAMWPRTTNPCADLAKTEIATSLFNIQSLDFDQTTQEFCQFQIVLPRKWNNGTVTAVFYWTAAAGSGDVQWGISGGAYSNDDALTVAFGTEQTADDTLLATNDLHISPATSAITLAGTPADADFLAFQISRNPGSDTLNADAKLLGVSIRLNTDSALDA